MVYLQLLLKFLFGGLAIVGVSLLTRYVHPRWGGVIAVAPIGTLLSIIFVRLETDDVTTRALILHSIYYLVPTLAFLVTMYYLIERLSLPGSLIVAYAVWGVMVAAMQYVAP